MESSIPTLGLVVGFLILLGATVSAASIPLLKRVARRTGFVDRPAPHKFHESPILLLGGGAVFLPWLILVWLAPAAIYFGGVLDPLRNNSLLPDSLRNLIASVNFESVELYSKLGVVSLGASILFIVGLLDDRMGSRFPRLAKVAAQLLAGSLLAAGGVRTQILPNEAANLILTLLWVLAVTNAFNLLDNMDGLVSGVSVLAGCLLLAVAVSQGQILISASLALLVGTNLGFLPWNFPKATVFLGDAGSQVLGFLFASLSLLESYVTAQSPGLFPVVLPVLVVAVPLFDTLTVVVYRWRSKAPLTRGDTNHLSHRLVRIGLTPPQAVLTHWLLTLSCGAPACLLPWLPAAGVLVVFLQSLAILMILWIFVAWTEGGSRVRARD